jgi:hypothetical protein
VVIANRGRAATPKLAVISGPSSWSDLFDIQDEIVTRLVNTFNA